MQCNQQTIKEDGVAQEGISETSKTTLNESVQKPEPVASSIKETQTLEVTKTPSSVETTVIKEESIAPEQKSYTIDPDKVAQKAAEDAALASSLEKRTPLPATGNPNATVMDHMMVQVEPRYVIVQNQSDKFLVVPDMKTNDDDMGLTFQPGEVVVLTDFYTPQEINRSKGLRHAATDLNGVGGRPILVPLSSEEEGLAFKVPKKTKYSKGTMFEDTAQNDFDDRFAELEAREAKREEKLLKKTLASRKLKKHGQAPSRV